MSEPWPVMRELRATRDERERRDEQNGRKHRVRQELQRDIRGSKLRKPRTSNPRVSSVPLFSPFPLVFSMERQHRAGRFV